MAETVTGTTMNQAADFDTRLNERLNDMLLQHTSLTQFLVLVNALLVYLILYRYLQGGAISIWLLTIAEVAVFRMIIAGLYWRRRRDSRPVGKLVSLFLVLSCLSGVTWGVLIFIIPDQEVWMEAFVAFVLAGTSAGKMITNSARLSAALPFLLLILSPLAYHYATIGNPEHLAMAVMVTLYLFLLIRLSYRIHDMQYQSIRSDLENSDMYKVLKRAKRDADDTRSRLESEVKSLPGELVQLEVFFDRSPDLLAITESDGRFVQANPALLGATGIDEDSFDKYNLFDCVHEEDLGELRAELEHLKNDLDDHRCQLRLQWAGGGYRPLDCYLLYNNGLYYFAGREKPEQS